MIFIDIETSGLDPQRHCILSIGAVDYKTGQEFYQECSVYTGSAVDDGALAVNGFTLGDIQPGKKQEAWRLCRNFSTWVYRLGYDPEKTKPVLAGHNLGGFDISFLKVGLLCDHKPYPFSHRTVDLHSIAYFMLGESLSLSDICRKLDIEPEPKPHNALNGARAARDCFKALSQHRDSLSEATGLLLKEMLKED